MKQQKQHTVNPETVAKIVHVLTYDQEVRRETRPDPLCRIVHGKVKMTVEEWKVALVTCTKMVAEMAELERLDAAYAAMSRALRSAPRPQRKRLQSPLKAAAAGDEPQLSLPYEGKHCPSSEFLGQRAGSFKGGPGSSGW